MSNNLINMHLLFKLPWSVGQVIFVRMLLFSLTMNQEKNVNSLESVFITKYITNKATENGNNC